MPHRVRAAMTSSLGALAARMEAGGATLTVEAPNGDVIRIGKAPENDLVLADETVSRVHFEIVRDAKGYLVRDLKSTNGTFLDSAEVKEAYLRAGSVIAIGATELKFTPFEERIEILPSEKEALGEMVGKSPAMREIFGLVERIAPTDARSSSIASQAAFERPYGLTGSRGAVSGILFTRGSPYTAQVDESTKPGTSASRADATSDIVPAALFSQYFQGSRTLSPT